MSELIQDSARQKITTTKRSLRRRNEQARTQKNNCLLQGTKGDVRRTRKSKDEDREVGERGGATNSGNSGLWEGWAGRGRQVPRDRLRGQGAEASPGHPHVEDTGPRTKACESTNREDSGNSASTPVLTRDRAQGDPRRPVGGLAQPSPAHSRPAGLTPTRGPGSL